MVNAREVAELIRLLIVIQRASSDASQWEDVGRLFVRLCESFSGDALGALHAVREWIADDDSLAAAASSEAVIRRLPFPNGRGDAVEDLRDIVAPAVCEAIRHSAARDSSAAAAARLDLCLEHCTQGLMTFASSGGCLFVNRVAARLLKLPVDPKAGPVDRRILPRSLRAMIDEFSADPSPKPMWMPPRFVDVGGDRVQCFPLVVSAGTHLLLHLFLVAEARSDSLAERLERSVRLSRQEKFVFRAILDGKSNGRIAKEMGLSVHTVRTYVERVYEKLNVGNRYELLKRVTSAADYPTLEDSTR